MRTPLSRVRGLGSAHEGTGHFWKQRLTAVANVPLVLGFVWFVICALGSTRAEFAASAGNPFVAALLILFIVSGVVHMKLGMQVIIEDYIHGEALKMVLLMLNIFFPIIVGAASVFALAKIAFGG